MTFSFYGTKHCRLFLTHTVYYETRPPNLRVLAADRHDRVS